MKITIGKPENTIPRILNGNSANTLFYLINYEKIEQIFKDTEYYGSSASMNTPYDTEDFERIMNAYNVFGWTQKDIQKAEKTAIEINASKKIQAFLENFNVLQKLFENACYDDFELALSDIIYNPENQKDSGEFTIDISKLKI